MSIDLSAVLRRRIAAARSYALSESSQKARPLSIISASCQIPYINIFLTSLNITNTMSTIRSISPAMCILASIS